MKPITEIREMLFRELEKVRRNKLSIENECYDVSTIGDTSALISGLLQAHLSKESEWSAERWIDDIVISKLSLNENVITVWGVVIWGIFGMNKQWTEPVFCKISMNNAWSHIAAYELFFGDQNTSELLYEDYSKDKGYWDGNYYTDNSWNPQERSWKFFIVS